MIQCVDIYLIVYDKSDKNESIGIESEDIATKTTFWFSDTALTGFYIDDNTDEYTKTQDIIFFCGGNSYRTPFNPETFQLLTSILKRQEHFIYNLS
jgi:hypothetical protein